MPQKPRSRRKTAPENSSSSLTGELQAAQRAAAQYRDMAACANDLLLLIDENGNCRAANRSYLTSGRLQMADIYGQSVEKLVGCPLIEASTPALIRRCLDGEAVHFRKWYQFHSLGRRYLDVGFHPPLESFGESRHIVLVGRDVTEAFEYQVLSEFSAERSEIFTAAFDQIHLGIIVTQVPDGKVFLMNAEAERMLGVSQREMTGQALYTSYGAENGWICLYPDRRPCRLKALPSHRALVEGTVTRNAELILQRKGADDIWVMVNSGPIRSRLQKAIGIVTVLSDITKAKHEQERIRANEERLDYALKAIGEGIWDWNLKTGTGYYSERYFSLLGYDDNEFPPTLDAWLQLLHPDDRKRAAEKMAAFEASGKETLQLVNRMRTKGGEYRWILSSAMVTERNRNGRPIRIVGSAKDVTKRRQMEIKLQQSHDKMEAEVRNRTRDLLAANRQLESIFNLSSESIWVSDCQGNVLKVSQASERLLNIKAENIVGRNVKDLVAEGMMDQSATLEVLATRRRVSMIQHVSQNGRQLLVTGTPIFDENGGLALVTVVERDLTELNELQRQLKNSQSVSSRLKEELNELKMLETQKQPVVAESPKMQNVIRIAGKLANQNISNILILGESGTGKGLLASLIHENSPRKEEAFIGINCAALPDTLLEAELFGYEKGAFTGARKQGKAGLFELAQKGTLFLDEIGDLPLPLQAKLLKYLDDNTIMRLGGLKPIHIDCTIIAATNLDLESLVNQKKFRRDLYYRLNTFTIFIPPLRQRREDILELTRHFIERYNKEFKTRKRLSLNTFNAIQSHRFPGNVRELKALIKKAVVLSEGESLDPVVLEAIGRNSSESSPESAGPDLGPTSLADRLNDFERQVLIKALKKCRSTREMARYLGSSQTSIVRKLKKHGLTTTETQ